MTPIVDCHTHTHFSDGTSTFEENVRAAAAAGCAVLVSTDHLTLPASMDPTGEAQVVESDLAAHRAAFEEARALAGRLDGGPELVYGFECDWYVGCEPLVERWSAGAVVRLGSVHWIGDPVRAGDDVGWIDYAADLHVWRALGPDEVWRRYADAWCAACESPLAFDSMAHPDLAMRFAREGLAPMIDLVPLWDRMVSCARDTGRRVELSTAGLRKSVADYYPTRGLLERFAAAGVPLTVGSDAHCAPDVCWGVGEAYAHAARCGYRCVEVPHADGDWETVALA